MEECKAICTKCRYQYHNPYEGWEIDNYECYFEAKEEINCVTGGTYINYTALCKDKNSKGECEDFEHIPRGPEPEVKIEVEPPEIKIEPLEISFCKSTYKYEWYSRTQRWVRTLDRVEEIDD